jgi:pantetheine-phosphate adenylyltransferase
VITAICPGSYDPVTMGHVDVIKRAAAIFDRVVVGVVREPHHKRTMFSLEERLEIAQELAVKHPNVEVISFDGLLSDFVVEHGGKVVVRGGSSCAGCAR